MWSRLCPTCSHGGRSGGGLLLPVVHRGVPRLSETTVLSCVWTSGDRLSDGGLSFPVGAASPPPVASSAVRTERENHMRGKEKENSTTPRSVTNRAGCQRRGRRARPCCRRTAAHRPRGRCLDCSDNRCPGRSSRTRARFQRHCENKTT